MRTIPTRTVGEGGGTTRPGRLVLAACAADDAFAACVLRSVGPRPRRATVSMLVIGDDRAMVPRATTNIRAALEANWLAPLPITGAVGASSWGSVAIGRSTLVAMSADRANEAVAALAGHAFWEAATARLRSGADLVAFGPALHAEPFTGEHRLGKPA